MTTSPLTDSELVFSALNLFPNGTRGARPDWQELEAFRARSLSPERAAEVLSHIANDPDCFQQWLDLGEAEQWLLEESAPDPVPNPASTTSGNDLGKRLTGTMQRWLQSLLTLPAPAYAGAMAAILVAVLVIPLLQRPDSLALDAAVDRSLDSYLALSMSSAVDAPIARSTRRMDGVLGTVSMDTVERVHFERGLQASLGKLVDAPSAGWRSWSSSLASEPLDCQASVDPGACDAITDTLYALGRWTLINWFACHQPVMVDGKTFWDEQLSVYQSFRGQDRLHESQVFGPVLAANKPGNSTALCRTVDALMAASR